LKELIDSIEALKKEADARGPDVTDCEGLLGYESEKSGDGLTGYYFDNE
jgi:hypothetical protein